MTERHDVPPLKTAGLTAPPLKPLALGAESPAEVRALRLAAELSEPLALGEMRSKPPNPNVVRTRLGERPPAPFLTKRPTQSVVPKMMREVLNKSRFAPISEQRRLPPLAEPLVAESHYRWI